jgi:aflatoxin B1 aldehyde reductase
MTFGPPDSEPDGARITSLDTFTQCLDYFQKSGYNEVDTAESYVGTKQQAFTCAAGWKERGLTLATKYYPRPGAGHTAQVLRDRLEFSLKELGTDCVDIFYLHAADRTRPFVESLAAVNQLHKEGKFVQLGLSNFAAFEVAECVAICQERGWVRPTIYQGMYNAILRSLDHETITACHRYGIDVVVYNPLAGGLFSGKIKSKDIIPDSGRFSDKSTATTQGKMYRGRYFRDGTFEALQVVEKAAEKAGLTMLEIALQWCVHHSKLKLANQGGNDGVIIGVSSYEQLVGNVKDFEKGPLPQEVVDALDQAWLLAKPYTPDYWHGKLEYEYDTSRAFEKM